MSVTSIIARIREHDKTRCTLPVEHTEIIGLPVEIHSEIYQDGQLSYAGRSKSTTPQLIEFVKETMAGRFGVMYLDKVGQISFHTRDGACTLLVPLVVAKAIVAGIGR